MGLFQRTPAIEPKDAAAAQAAGALLVDIREQYEWDAGRIPGAMHVPMGELGARIAEIPTDRPVVVVCRSGNRSAHVTRALVNAGLDATNLTGGTRAWVAQGLPLDPPDGHVA